LCNIFLCVIFDFVVYVYLGAWTGGSRFCSSLRRAQQASVAAFLAGE
jgi:hypothetical protein